MADAGRDLAGEHALGLLEGEERAAAAARARTDSAFVKDVETWGARFAGLALESLPGGDDLVVPPAEIWAAISARVAPPVTARRADEGIWFAAGPGATMKMLAVDPPSGRRSALLRLQPDTVFAAHAHDDLEECLVIEGEIDIDGVTYRPGDYVVATAGTMHPAIPSPRGALVLLHWSPL